MTNSLVLRDWEDESEVNDGPVTGYGGHATQILWRSTKQLGCGVSVCESGEKGTVSTLVCNYDPP